MGNVKIRYYVIRRAWKGSRATWGYWVPTKAMRAAGFRIITCGVDGPAAWAKAEKMNAQWDAFRRGETTPAAAEPGMPTKHRARTYPPGSLGEAFARYRRTSSWIEAKKPRTKEDWWRGWDYIEPIFGDVDPATVAMEDLDLWYAGDSQNAEVKGLLGTIGVREAGRAVRIWRALWRAAGTLNRADGKRYCDRVNDPSLSIRCKTAKPRSAIWREGEAVRLVKAAWRMGYRGLAAALAVAWDTMLSPVDVRTLTRAQLHGDEDGPLFQLSRAKTGKPAIGTLGKRTKRLLDAYMAQLPPNLLPSSPIFYTRGGVAGAKGGRPRPPAPYTKDTFGDDFRVIRAAVFPGDLRQIMDFRRSGAVEAKAGAVDPAALADKMANTIDANAELQSTYLPINAKLVRLADAARARGRNVLRDRNGSGSKS